MRAAFESIGPKRAKQLFTNHKKSGRANYRKMSQKRVANMAEQMTSGHWENNGQSISIASDGTIVDGQHRLAAVIRSGVTVRFLVVYDAPLDSVAIDTGSPRAVRDNLAHEGFKNTGTLAAVIRLILIHETGKWSWGALQNVNIPRRRFVDYAHENIDKLEAATRITTPLAPSSFGIPQTRIAAILYLGAANNDVENSELANWFAEKLVTGEDLQRTDAVYHLREAALRFGASANVRREDDTRRALACIAWNKTVSGEPCKQLKITATGPARAQIPLVIQEVGDNGR